MSPRLIIELTERQVDLLADWQECAAARIVDLGDGTARLEIIDDLEKITRPEPASVPCPSCHQTGTVIDSNGRSWRCHQCNGTGVIPAGEGADSHEF